MNTYDPMNCIVYLHLTRETDPYAAPVTSDLTHPAQIPR
jgi:hypothetical protein